MLALVAGHGMRLTLTDVAIGLAGAFAVGLWMRGLLFGVGNSDPATLVGARLALLLVALAACAVPALHASRVDPVTALRGD